MITYKYKYFNKETTFYELESYSSNNSKINLSQTLCGFINLYILYVFQTFSYLQQTKQSIQSVFIELDYSKISQTLFSEFYL